MKIKVFCKWEHVLYSILAETVLKYVLGEHFHNRIKSRACTSQMLMGIKRLQTYQKGLRNRAIKSFQLRKWMGCTRQMSCFWNNFCVNCDARTAVPGTWTWVLAMDILSSLWPSALWLPLGLFIKHCESAQVWGGGIALILLFLNMSLSVRLEVSPPNALSWDHV